MKCFYHNDRDATATCRDCGKGLCAQCTGRFTTIFCEECLLRNNKAVSVQMYKGLVITFVIFVGVSIFFANIKDSKGESLGYSIACMTALGAVFTYHGWKFLSERQCLMFIGSPGFWLFYFFLKLTIANMIGIVVGPYMIYKMVKEIRVVKKTKVQIENGEI